MHDTLVVTIPATPDKCLSPNNVRSARHWGPRARATKHARDVAYYTLRNANVEMWEPEPPLVIHAVIAWEKVRTPRYPNGRYRQNLDPDSATGILKATVDGIADALGVNDRHITLASVQQEHDPEGRGFVRVAITPAAKEAA